MKKRMMKVMCCLAFGGAFLLFLPSIGLSQCSVCICPTLPAPCPDPCQFAYSNIQAAIRNALDWSTISVTGTCEENIEIASLKRGITLLAVGTAAITGPNPTIPTVLVGGDNITIKGFTIGGGQHGIFVYRNGNVIIDGNTIESTGGHGIGLENSATARILNNTIRNNRHGDGIRINENSSARIGVKYPFDTSTQPNTIEYNAGNGITVLNSSSALIVGNTISENGSDGIRVASVSQADISDNTIDGNDGNGILVTQNSGVNLGNDTGDTIFDLPNTTTLKNGLFGLKGTIGGYADGWLGTLDGLRGRVFFDLRSINSTKPWVW
jgi:parallel beta-helix repeat protein